MYGEQSRFLNEPPGSQFSWVSLLAAWIDPSFSWPGSVFGGSTAVRVTAGAFVIPVHCDPRGSPKNGSGALSVSVAYAKPGERIESPSVYDE